MLTISAAVDGAYVDNVRREGPVCCCYWSNPRHCVLFDSVVQATAWPVGPNGLLFDREWALVDDSSKVVTQKACPRMATLEPRVDAHSGTLTITARDSPNLKPLVVSLGSSSSDSDRPSEPVMQPQTGSSGSGQSVVLETGLTQERITVCGESVCGTLVSEKPAG